MDQQSVLPAAPIDEGAPAGEGAAARDSLSAIMALVRSIDSYRHRLANAADLGITELRAISRISLSGSLTPKQLADALDLTTGSVTALLDRLEGAGLIARAPHPTDRRMLELRLTDAGRERVAAVLDAFEGRIGAAVRTMPPEDVAVGNELVVRIARALADRTPEGAE